MTSNKSNKSMKQTEDVQEYRHYGLLLMPEYLLEI